jgi:hypothetical protein
MLLFMTKNTGYEVVSGTRMNPGQVLKAFPTSRTYRCGGPATAALRWWDSQSRKPGAESMFFRKVSK